MRDYIELYGCRIGILNEGKVCPINDDLEVYLPCGASYDIQVSYHGEEAVQYWLYINDKYIAESIGKDGGPIQLPTRLCKAQNDVCDIHQNFYGKDVKWKFAPTDGSGVKIRFTVATARLAVAEETVYLPTGSSRCTVVDGDERKTHHILTIGYKIDVDMGEKSTVEIILKEKVEKLKN